MMIIGCDFHPSWQQVSWVDTETGECGERKLVHAGGEAKMFYQQLAAPALIGMEATGNSQWFLELVAGPGTRDLGRRCSADPGQLRAQAEDGQAGCGPHSEAGGGEPISALVDAGPGAARSAAAGVASAQAGGDSQPGEERTATPFHEQGNAEEGHAVEPGRTEDVARAAVETLGIVPAGRLAGAAGDVEPADREVGRSGAEGGRGGSAGEVADDPAGSGSEHGAGVRADHRAMSPAFPEASRWRVIWD